MSMTPGKWSQPDYTVSREFGRDEYPVHAAKRGRIAVAYRQDDARAIAALPDLVEALKQYEKAFDDLFASCASNGIFNVWGKSVNCLNLNEAHQKAENALNKAGVTHD